MRRFELPGRLDALEAVDVELDLSHDKLNLFSRDHCAGEVVYWDASYSALPLVLQATGNIILKMILDSHPVEVGIATTRTHALMPLSVATLDPLSGSQAVTCQFHRLQRDRLYLPVQDARGWWSHDPESQNSDLAR